MGRAFIDRTSERYGRVSVVKYLGKLPGRTKNYWECLCDCGNTTTVTSSNLATGHTVSCGCATSDAAKQRRLYPLEAAAEYGIWRGIRQRTGNSSGKNAAWYTNISMCPTWKESFDTFYADMGKRPSTQHSIERKDNSLGYSASNCIWATDKVQANNRRTNLLLTLNGETRTASQWADIVGIRATTICARVNAYGWSDHDALTQPLGTRNV